VRFPELYRGLLDAGAQTLIQVAAWPARRLEHFAAPRLRKIHVEQDARRQSFLQNDWHELASEFRGGLEIHFLRAIGLRNRDGRDAVDRCFARGAHGAGVIDVLAHICAAIDSGNHEVRFLLQQSVKGENHRVRGSAFDSVFALRNFVTINGLAKRERLCRSAALLQWSNYSNNRAVLESIDQRAESGGMNPVIVGD